MQRREHGREIAAVRGECRYGHGEARLPQRRIPVAAKIMIEAPIQQCPAHNVHVGKACRIAQRAERGFGCEQAGAERVLAALFVGRSGVRTLAIKDRERPRTAMIDERLLLDLRLEAQRRRARCRKANLDRIGVGDVGVGIVVEAGLPRSVHIRAQADLKLDPNRLVGRPLAGPYGGIHPAL
jgi:hypothetical protein